jgi:hypothetical protein
VKNRMLILNKRQHMILHILKLQFLIARFEIANSNGP